MIGKLYSIKYIEEHFPWAIQKYEDNNGEFAKAFYGVSVNEASKNFLLGYFHTIEGPFYIYNGSLDQYEKYYKIKDSVYNGVLIPEVLFEDFYEEESVPTKEEKKSHKVAIRKSTKEEKIHPLITKNFINIADLKWWSIDEKIPPVGLPITLCVKEHPFTSNCSPYNAFPAKYHGWNSSACKYVFINMNGEYFWYLTEDDFRWTVDAGRCPDF